MGWSRECDGLSPTFRDPVAATPLYPDWSAAAWKAAHRVDIMGEYGGGMLVACGMCTDQATKC
eukprot:364796-Chlamydomonas_euryale.AAC.7